MLRWSHTLEENSTNAANKIHATTTAPAPSLVRPASSQAPVTNAPVPTLPPTLPDTHEDLTPMVSPEVAKQRTKIDLMALLSDENIKTESSSSREALTWIASYDPAHLNLANNNNNNNNNNKNTQAVLQRSSLAALCYAKHPDLWANTTLVEDTKIAGRMRRNLESSSSTTIFYILSGIGLSATIRRQSFNDHFSYLPAMEICL